MSIAYWSCLLVIALFTNVSLQEINLNYQTIEDSCTLQMTLGLAYTNINVGLLRYKQQCKNMEEFINCVWRRRQMWDVININIPIYDRYFPRIEDLRYAGYIFCKAYLPLLQQLFPPSVNMSSCKIPVDDCRKKHVNDGDVKALRKAVNSRQSEIAISLSCRLMAPYTNCIREAYIACNRNYRMVFDYEMAKMGGICLATMNLTAPLVAMNRCDPRFSDPGMIGRYAASGSGSIGACAAFTASFIASIAMVTISVL